MLTLRERKPDRCGVTTLYKFRACETDEEVERVKALLPGKLWFSPVKEFNDPFEARPRFAPRFSDPAKQAEAIQQYAREACRRRNLDATQEAALLEEIARRGSDEWLYDAEDFREEMANECYVF